jgi:hypothetical protein
MITTLEGVYRNGHVELLETPVDLEEARVFVTFVPPSPTKARPDGPDVLADLGIDEAHAIDLRHRLKTFVADWDLPEMDVYNAL